MGVGLRDVSVFGAKSNSPSSRSAHLPGYRGFGGIEILIGEWHEDIGDDPARSRFGDVRSSHGILLLQAGLTPALADPNLCEQDSPELTAQGAPVECIR